MPRKIYYEHRKHRYVRTNSYAQTLWIDERDYKDRVPHSPNWRTRWEHKPLLNRGKKP